MRHQWVIDVLLDLQSYAAVNDLPHVSAQVQELLTVARLEIRAGSPCTSDTAETQGLQKLRRAH